MGESDNGEPRTPSPGRRTGVRQLHRELTRSRLVEAGVECFTTAGYVATTIDHITTAAGTTRATFYLHFKSKADVVIEMLSGLGGEYQAAFAALAAVAENPDRAAVRHWLDSTLRIWETTSAASAVAAEAAVLEPSVQAHREATFERDIDQLTAALQKSGRWDGESARVRAILMMSQLEQLFLRWSTHGWDVDRADVVEVLTAMWSAALGLPDGTG